MNGIKCALTGRLSRPAESQTSSSGREYVRMNVAVDKKDHDEPTQWVTAMCFVDNLQTLVDRGQKGARVYIEGSLKADVWTPDNGRPPRVSLTCFAWTAFVMGAIGINDSDASSGKGKGPRPPMPRQRDEPPPPTDADCPPGM